MVEKFMKDMEKTVNEIRQITNMSGEQALSIMSIVEGFFLKHFDAYEALTPPPQGDVPIETIAKSLGDSGKILLDGIPATLFLREFPESKLIEITKKILRYDGRAFNPLQLTRRIKELI